MRPPLDEAMSYYLPRKDLHDWAETRRMRAGRRGCILGVEGFSGMGKSLFLKNLWQEIDATGYERPIWVDLNSFNPKLLGDGPSEDVPLARSFEHYRRLVATVAEGLPEDTPDEHATATLNVTVDVTADLQGFTGGSITVGPWGKIEGARDIITGVKIENLEIDPSIYIGPAREQLNKELSRRFRLVREHRVVLLADNFSSLLGSEIADWIVEELLPSLDNTVTILAGERFPEVMPIERAALRRFSLDEVRAYLMARLEPASVPEELVEHVFEITGGHPASLGIVASKLRRDGVSETTEMAMFAEIEPGDWRSLVRRILADIGDRTIRDAITFGCIARRFSAQLLRCLMEECGYDEELGSPSELIERLESYAIVEPDILPGHYRFLDFIREDGDKKLAADDPDRHARLHALAADHYTEFLSSWAENRPQHAYLSWYVYEDPQWQVMAKECVYHLAQLQDREAARFALAQTYFDAFWWWGAYMVFPLCEAALQEWEDVKCTDEDSEFLDVLRLFDRTYLKESERPGPADWEAVFDALLGLRGLAGVDGDPDRLDGRRRHLLAILDVFLAEARSYFDDSSRADRYLMEAIDLFGGLGDSWGRAWALYYWAELHFRRNDHADALQLGDQARQFAFDISIEDYELGAKCHLLFGDINWARARHCDAVESYARAGLCGYLFQGRPHPPDRYTQLFYEQLGAGVVGRLLSLHAEGKRTEALDACARLRAFWDPYWRLVGERSAPDFGFLLAEGRRAELVEVLFPAAPTDGELDTASSYTRRITRVCEEMADELGTLSLA